ncbi:hypothetical protein LCGC14_2022940, partial [marine sediment metagenome]
MRSHERRKAGRLSCGILGVGKARSHRCEFRETGGRP